MKQLLTYCILCLIGMMFGMAAQAQSAATNCLDYQVIQVDELAFETAGLLLNEVPQNPTPNQDIESEPTDNDDEQDCLSYAPNWLFAFGKNYLSVQFSQPDWVTPQLIDPPAAMG